ncbi:hypothetical protein [Nonomuraea sp. KM88]|uniref:hypothetical protein n=1 Tax=Nonomuraea sp. KM88 TaxID=3457427 RepID=UPI003FCE438F
MGQRVKTVVIVTVRTGWPTVLGFHIPVLDLGPLYGDLAPVAPYRVVAAALAVLAVRRAGADRTSGKARWWGATMPARSPWWLPVPLVARDGRWALATAVHPLPGLGLPGRKPACDRRSRRGRRRVRCG